MINKSMALGAIAALALSAQAQAQTFSAVAITGGGFTVFGQLAGYAFSVSTPIQVTSLGIYDHNADGLQSSHDIGLWTSSSTLLSQATIAAGAGTLVGGFRYTSISPVVLQPGNYVVAATPGLDAIWMKGSISTAPAITFMEARYAETSSLVFPTDSLQMKGVLGGSFQYTAVPEPSSWVVAGVFGVGAVVTVGMRRRQAAKA